MVSESNINRRHLRISNTHDQIHYNNNTSKPGVHIQDYPIQICSISDGGQINLYLKVFKYFLSILTFYLSNIFACNCSYEKK